MRSWKYAWRMLSVIRGNFSLSRKLASANRMISSISEELAATKQTLHRKEEEVIVQSLNITKLTEVISRDLERVKSEKSLAIWQTQNPEAVYGSQQAYRRQLVQQSAER